MEVKSAKKQVNKKLKIMWIVVAILIILQFILSVVNYISYKNGQKYAITSAEFISLLSDANVCSSYGSYSDKCEDIYSYLTKSHYDMNIGGYQYDGSYARESQRIVSYYISDFMEDAGYDNFDSYEIENWFKCTNFFQYYWFYSLNNFFFYVVCVILLIASVLTIIINIITQKELIITDNILVCKYNKRKSKEILIKDISGVQSSRSALKVNGNGFKFNISLITNAEELKKAIMERKNLL